jgi:hypothetical protein
VSRPVNLDVVASPVSQTCGYSLHVRYPVVVEGPYTVREAQCSTALTDASAVSS